MVQFILSRARCHIVVTNYGSFQFLSIRDELNTTCLASSGNLFGFASTSVLVHTCRKAFSTTATQFKVIIRTEMRKQKDDAIKSHEDFRSELQNMRLAFCLRVLRNNQNYKILSTNHHGALTTFTKPKNVIF